MPFFYEKKKFAENTWPADSTVRIDKTTNGKQVSLEELTKNTHVSLTKLNFYISTLPLFFPLL
jgi:hypothetical protein